MATVSAVGAEMGNPSAWATIPMIGILGQKSRLSLNQSSNPRGYGLNRYGSASLW